MLKKSLILALTLITTNTVYSSEATESVETDKKIFESIFDIQTEIILPSSEILLERLSKAAFLYFAEKTKIHEKLGGKELNPFGVSLTLEDSFKDYETHVKDPLIANYPRNNSSTLLKTILQDSPEAIKQLKKLNLIED